jgi:hypothetical protein
LVTHGLPIHYFVDGDVHLVVVTHIATVGKSIAERSPSPAWLRSGVVAGQRC